MEDFEPENVARQVEPLRKLLESRIQLKALLAKTDGNERLGERLQEIIGNTELLQRLGKDAGLGAAGGPGEAPAKEKTNE
jgi:type VI secretion system protein ImpB